MDHALVLVRAETLPLPGEEEQLRPEFLRLEGEHPLGIRDGVSELLHGLP
jgi:hypothetical protein